MSHSASYRTHSKRDEEKYLFMIKKYRKKNEKINKSKELEIDNDIPSKFFDICSLLYQSHPFVFPTKEVRRRCFYVGGKGRERGSAANIFFRFSTSFNMFFCLFWKRDKKRRCICGRGDGKELEKCREYVFFGPFSWNRLFIYIHKLQSYP